MSGAELAMAQDKRRLALIERLGMVADLACQTPFPGDLGDVAYDLLREAAAQIASDQKRLATPSQRLDAATVERCAQVVEDEKPRNDVSDWTEFARDKNAILTGIAARIRALSPQAEGEQ